MKPKAEIFFGVYTLCVIIILFFPSLTKGQDQWVYPGTASGFNGDVRTSAVFNGELYVGGNFTTVDNGATAANRIAKWNGTSWSAVGSGLDNNVRILYVYNSELYVGGYFSTAGGVSAVRIAKWDGASWSTVGTGVGFNGVPYTMATYGGDLYVGGEFQTVDGISTVQIAKWNGTTWSKVGNTGNGMNGAIYGLCVYNGNLYCGGAFSLADYVCCASGVACGSIAKWDGTNFSAPGTGITGSYIYKDMIVYNNELYVPGLFTAMNGVSVNNIAKYDGTTWTAVGTGVAGGGANAEINPLAIFSSLLYAGGNFTTADGVAAGKAAKWDGTIWAAAGTGLNGFVRTLCVYNGKIYAGGAFTTSGAVAVGKIATLPIDLLYFKAWMEGEENKLEWATASETNNSYFTIERSENGILFDAIATIEGAGTSSKRINYYSSDESPHKDISYYRLKQTDFDGKYTYSEVVSIKGKNNMGDDFSIYPNPINISDGNDFSITLYNLQAESTVLVVLYDVLGKQYFSKTVLADINGSIRVAIENGSMPSKGIYMVRAASDNRLFSKKVVIE